MAATERRRLGASFQIPCAGNSSMPLAKRMLVLLSYGARHGVHIKSIFRMQTSWHKTTMTMHERDEAKVLPPE